MPPQFWNTLDVKPKRREIVLVHVAQGWPFRTARYWPPNKYGDGEQWDIFPLFSNDRKPLKIQFWARIPPARRPRPTRRPEGSASLPVRA